MVSIFSDFSFIFSGVQNFRLQFVDSLRATLYNYKDEKKIQEIEVAFFKSTF